MEKIEQNHLIAILEATSDLVAIAKPDTTVTYMNRAGRHIVGWPEDYQNKKRVIADVHPDWATQIIIHKGFPQAIEGGIWHGETALIGRNREEIPVSQVIMCHKSDDGEHIDFLSTIMRDISEQKRIEQALRLREEQFRTVIESSLDAMVSIDQDALITLFNPAAEKIFGWKREEVVGKSLDCILPEEIRNRHAKAIFNFFKRGKSAGPMNQTLELPAKHKQGHTFLIELSLSTGQKGEKGFVLAIIRDITDQHLARKALTESEEKYRALYYRSRDAFMIVHPKEGFISGNESTVRLFGCQSEAEFTSKTPADLSPKFQPDGSRSTKKAQLMMAIALEKGSHFFEWKHRRVNGEEFFATVLLTRMNLQENTVLQATVRDISSQKEMVKALRESEEKFRRMIEFSPYPIVVTHNKAIIFINKKFVETFGYSLSDIPTLSSLWDLAFPDKKQLRKARSSLEQVVGQAGNQASKIQLLNWDVTCRDGSSKTVEFNVSPVGDLTLIIMADITEKKRNQELIIQTEKMISIGGLAAGMAHEINNPLAGILQNIQVIRNRLFSDLNQNVKAAEECGISLEQIQSYMVKRGINNMMDSVIESGKRASQVVDNMLSFSRKSPPVFAPHRLADLMEKTIELASNDYDLKSKYDFRHILIKREYASNMPMVYCEASKIQQVFFNILKNGAHAMTQNRNASVSPQFTIRLFPEKDRARIEIEDNGPGMDEPTRKRVFEPFYTTKSNGFGLGLGLSISYFIITENHKGSMEVHSDTPKGTIFIIKLPFGSRSG